MRKEGPISCIAYDAIGNGADLDSALRRWGLPALIPCYVGRAGQDEKQASTSAASAGAKCASSWRTADPRRRRPGEQLISLDYGYDARVFSCRFKEKLNRLQIKKDLIKEKRPVPRR